MAARAKNPITVLGPDGRPLAGASVYTRDAITGVDATVYAGRTGATAGANPATSDARGRISQWLGRGAYTSTVTAAGMDPWVEEWDATPGSDGALDATWIPDDLVIARMIATDAVGASELGPGAADYAALAADVLSAIVPIGGCISGPFASLPAGGRFGYADGGLIDKTTYAAFFAVTGHVYNGGVDPGSNMVRKADKRGRVTVGADNMGTGAAGRLPNSNRALGQNGGEERHTLLAAESGVNGSGVTGNDSPDHVHATPANVVSDWTTGGNLGAAGNYNKNQQPNSGGASTRHTHALVARTADVAHNVLQPYEVDHIIQRIAL